MATCAAWAANSGERSMAPGTWRIMLLYCTSSKGLFSRHQYGGKGSQATTHPSYQNRLWHLNLQQSAAQSAAWHQDKHEHSRAILTQRRNSSCAMGGYSEGSSSEKSSSG